jgi:hypothetical protein
MRAALIALMLSAALVFAAEPTVSVAVAGKLESCRDCGGKGFGYCSYPDHKDVTKNRKLLCGFCDGEGQIIRLKNGGKMKVAHTPQGEVLRAEVHVRFAEEVVAKTEQILEEKRQALAKARADFEAAKAAVGKPADLPAEKL